MAFGILPKFSSIPAANDVEMNWGLSNANRSINNIGTTCSEFSDLLKLLSAEPLLFGARKKGLGRLTQCFNSEMVIRG